MRIHRLAFGIGFAVAVWGLALGQQAAPARVTFAIEEQPLSSALIAFAKQAHVQILRRDEEVPIKGKRAPAVKGELSAEEALAKLLENTGFRYEFVNADTVRIVRGESAAEQMPVGMRVAQGDSSSATAERSGAAAQEQQPASTEGKAQESEKLAEIVVTAQKRVERLIDVPQSVSVVSADTLSKLGATQFSDFASTVPGMSFTTDGPGFTQITLRGVTSGFDIGPTVGVYVDDVPYGSSSNFAFGAQHTLDVGLFDIDQIEVLRGPQGTLYGSSTMGGLVKYVSKRPQTTRFDGNARVGLSGTQDGDISYNAAAAVNVPFVPDKVAMRASGYESHDGGYIDNLARPEKDVNSSDIYGGRLDLLFTPSDSLTIRLGAFLQNISRDGDATADYTFDGAQPNGSLGQRRLVDEPFDQRFRLASGTVAYDFGPVTLTSISSYQEMESDGRADASAAYIPVLAFFLGRSYSSIADVQVANTDKFTQEVRLAGEGGRPLEWVLGGFYTHENTFYSEEFVLRDSVGQPSPNDVLIYRAPSRFEDLAAFGNLTWHLTDEFDISGGIRRAHNRQTFEQTGASIFTAPALPTSEKNNVSTYLANARYHFSPRAVGYLRYATGYRPGGPNIPTTDANGDPLGPPRFDADKLKSYEVGFKSETEDRRLGIDLAGYQIDWDNMQIQTVLSNGIAVIENATGGATVRGAELALTARPGAGFTTSGSFAYQDAKLSDAEPLLGGAENERLPNVPRWSAALTADYELPLGSWRPTVGATLRYVDDRTSTFDNTIGRPQYHLPNYTMVDLRTGFEMGSVDAQLYVHNVFDKRAQLANTLGVFGPRITIQQPRTIGVTVTMKFD